MALAGTVLGGRYELAEQVGNGGYCEVWRARDTELSRDVAVKLLHPGYTGKTEALARFRAEARHAGALSHPNIAQVYDYGDPADGQPSYLVMELVDGPSLEEMLAGGPLGVRPSMDVIAQAAAGLQAAHDAGLIHRDVKPANLLLASGGIVKIADFGIAYAAGAVPLTPSGEMMGTPGYHAPEQVTGKEVTPASDLYALGVVAYECLAGAPPFTGAAMDVAVAHRDRPLPLLSPSVPASVRALVADLTAKDPARRPGSAGQVALRAAQLRDAGPWSGLETTVTAAADEPPRPGSRRPALALAAVVLAGLTCLILVSLAGFGPPWPGIRTPSSGSPSLPPGTVAPARTAGSPGTSPASPAARPRPAASTANGSTAGAGPDTAAAVRPGRGHGRGNGHGNASSQGKGNGNAPS